MLSHEQLLLFWLQLVAFVAVARGLGGLLRRTGQPAVVDELAAGLVLGPSVFGQLAPDAQAWLFPDDPVQVGMLAAVGWVGALLLLIVTGYETDLRLIRRLGPATARVVVASLVVPVLAGIGVGFAMPAGFLGPEAERSVFALFPGVALVRRAGSTTRWARRRAPRTGASPWPSGWWRRRALAAELGAAARTEIRTGLVAPDVLLALARDAQVDLIVLAANLRQLSGRPFLGHGVEYLLEKSDCAVAVVTAPLGFAR